MSAAVATVDSPDAFRKHVAIMRHYAEDLAAFNDPSWLPFTEDQCADALFAFDPAGGLQRWAATIVYEYQNPTAPKVKLL